MNDANNYSCAICGEEDFAPRNWFIVTENSWEDKLKILEWNDQLASQAGIHSACSPAHVQELVVHWMATGSVAHPFARTEPSGTSQRYWSDICRRQAPINFTKTRTLGEIVVHRESMRRTLSENPGSLRSILDALHVVLQANRPASSNELDMFYPAAG